MTNKSLNLNKTSNMKDINRLRRELEKMYLHEKTKCTFISDKTIQYSQELDVYIVKEQRRLLNEYKLSKQNC